MPIPKSVVETIATLRQERAPLAARLDAIDLAIDNLNRIYGGQDERPTLVKARRTKAKAATKESAGGNTEASARREMLLALIAKSEHGVTGAELKKATPKMDSHDRGNALTVLRVKGQIRRSGNAWIKAA